MKEYCGECGAKKVEELTGMFDTSTGKPTVRLICPSACAHGFHTSRAKIPGLMGWFFVRCEKCGTKDFR